MRHLATALIVGLIASVGVACTSRPDPDDAAVHDARAAVGDAQVKSRRDARSANDDEDAQTETTLPHGSVRGRIIGVSAADSRSGLVSATGVSQLLSTDYFTLEGVIAGGESSIFARIPGYSLGHAQVAIEEGRAASVVLSVVELTTQPIRNPAGEQLFLFGTAQAQHGLSWPQGALAPVFGSSVAGTASFAAAILDAKSAPGGMWVRDGSERFRFRSLAMVEVRAWQPSASLVLTQNASLRLHVAANQQPQLAVYRFDEEAGVWQKHALADYDATTHTLVVSIARFGIYAAAEPLTLLGCVMLSVVDAAAKPLSRAAILYADEQATQGTQVWTDAAGRACLPASPGAKLTYTALAQDGPTLLGSAGELTSSDAAASCGAGCADGGISMTEVTSLRCVHGHIAALGINAAVGLWTSSAGAESKAGEVRPGQDFCIDLAGETELRFASTLHCPEPKLLPPSGGSASCGQTGCVELGSIQCCADTEACGNAIDDDCDQRIDEGCQCGSNDCGATRAARSGGDFCCTDDALCGLRDRLSKLDANRCFDAQTKSRLDATQCGDEVLDLGNGKQPVLGCCRADQRCGLKLAPLDCVPREDSKYFATSAPPLSAKSCHWDNP